MSEFKPQDIIATSNLQDVVEYIDQQAFSYIFIVVDENTHQHCLPLLAGELGIEIRTYSVLEVPAGESSKDLQICASLWESLTEEAADRNAVIINLGGGMVCDLGGFVASCYKRGIAFINMPTSYLAMVDAAIGGKCGIDFMGFKNQLGSFSFAAKIFIYTEFLNTLPSEELKSGFAESLKHGLIADRNLWETISIHKITAESIQRSFKIKSNIVDLDPFEKKERKKLNFGHTIGHAIESYFLEKKQPIPHGFAVAAGLICESFISKEKELLSQAEFQEIETKVDGIYTRLTFDDSVIDDLLEKMLQDKKNDGELINFTLLKAIGEAVVNQTANETLIRSAILFYLKK